MSAVFDKECGRLRVVLNENGAQDHHYGHGVIIQCPEGWNDSCPVQTHTVSVDELRDLYYMIGRALEAAGVNTR